MAGGVITTSAHPKALWPGVHKWFGRQYDEHPMEWRDLFDEETSDQAYEEDVELTGFGLAQEKAQGSATQYVTETQGYTKRYVHVAYSLGYITTYEELRDNLYEVVGKKRAGALAFSARQTKENVLANIYNRAFNSSYAGGDGKELCATDHPTLSGNQANEPTGGGADLSETAIEDLCIQIMQATNAQGLKISIQPVSLHIAPHNSFEAIRILKSVQQNDTANNAINALKSEGVLTGGAKVNHYFSSDNPWFIRTNAPSGMMMFQRDAYEFYQDNDGDTRNAKSAFYERYSGGWTDFRGLYGNPGP